MLKKIKPALYSCGLTIFHGGADQTRTDDPLHAMQVLYQLSYNPNKLSICVIYFIFLLAKCQIILLTLQ